MWHRSKVSVCVSVCVGVVYVCWCWCHLWRAWLHVDAVGCVGLQVDGLGWVLSWPGIHQCQVPHAARHSQWKLATCHGSHVWGSTCLTRTHTHSKKLPLSASGVTKQLNLRQAGISHRVYLHEIQREIPLQLFWSILWWQFTHPGIYCLWCSPWGFCP